MKNVVFTNFTKEYDESYNYFTLNFAYALSRSQQNVLYFVTALSPFYFKDHLANKKNFVKKDIIPPFCLYRFDQYFDYLLLADPLSTKKNPIDLKNVHTILRKQLRLIQKNYEFLVINDLHIWPDILEDLKLTEQVNIVYIDCLHYSGLNQSQINPQNSYLILDNYNPTDKRCLSIYAELKKAYINQPIYVLPYEEQPDSFYTKTNPVCKKSISFIDLVNDILMYNLHVNDLDK